jgi:glycosyltransferase involved in cell wall biosynthesis
MKKITFLYTHPIQYFAPLHKQINLENFCKSEVLYCENTTNGYFDYEFKKSIKWDIPLLEGYNSFFLKKSIFSQNSGFFKHVNFSIYKFLNKKNTDILFVHGWSYFTAIYSIIVARLFGIEVWLRGESPYCQEINKSKTNRYFKKIIFKYFLFKLINKFVYIGEENKKFYKQYNINDDNLIFFPYCVDNLKLIKNTVNLTKQKCKLQLNIVPEKFTILFSGKLIDKKKPQDLLQAFHKSGLCNFSDLIFIGDGNLSNSLKSYVEENKVNNVHFYGFINQSEIGQFYKAADLFVLPSGNGETWGLVVNEAMLFSLPIIVSDRVGCAKDLVKHNENGFIYKYGNVDDLTFFLLKAYNNKQWRINAGILSNKIVSKYSYNTIIDNLKININN